MQIQIASIQLDYRAVGLKLKHIEDLPYHSFRISMPNELKGDVATKLIIKRTSGWHSDKVVEHFTAFSKLQERKIADCLRKCSKPLAKQPQSTETPGHGNILNALPMSGVKRNSGVTASNNCDLNIVASSCN